MTTDLRLNSRYIYDFTKEDLESKKMVFIGGPRQVGKTTFAIQFLPTKSEQDPGYLNWDDLKTRDLLLKGELPANQKTLVLDEIHKFRRWRNLVKGFYDTHKSNTHFLVTGSARLDYYRRGGDSLQGRYHYYRLHPFSACEMNSNPTSEDIAALLQFGGFPEPLARGNTRFWRRWERERRQKVVQEDIQDLENIREVSLLELLVQHLPERIGSPLSVKGLRDAMEVAHESVERWLSILERLYFCYRISPYSKSSRIRAVKKEKKLYFWDWSESPEGGKRFENLVASQLLKYCHFVEDTEGYSMELCFLRDVDRREIDFVVLKDKRPLFAVECKSGESAPSPASFYFRERTSIPEFYQVHLGSRDYGNAKTQTRVLPFHTFCRELEMP